MDGDHAGIDDRACTGVHAFTDDHAFADHAFAADIVRTVLVRPDSGEPARSARRKTVTRRRVLSPNTITVIYSTPRRGTLSYVALIIYIAVTTVCWDRLALWPWLAMTLGAAVVLFIMGTLWLAEDARSASAGVPARR